MLIFHFTVVTVADPKLPNLLKMLIWAQAQLDEKLRYPHITDFVNATLEDPIV